MLSIWRIGFRNANNLAFRAYIDAHKVLREKKYIDRALSLEMISRVGYERATRLPRIIS